MMVPTGTLAMEFTFIDRDGGSARLTMRLPFSTTYEQANSIASLFIPHLTSLSDAALVRYQFRWNYREDSPDAPGIQSNVGYYLCLYYSNDVDTEPVFIPSPNPAFLEAAGSFAGIRLDMANPSVVALADALTTALASTVGPDASPWSRWLVVGGATR